MIKKLQKFGEKLQQKIDQEHVTNLDLADKFYKINMSEKV